MDFGHELPYCLIHDRFGIWDVLNVWNCQQLLTVRGGDVTRYIPGGRVNDHAGSFPRPLPLSLLQCSCGQVLLLTGPEEDSK